MTPKEIQAEVKNLKAEIGPEAHVTVSIDSFGDRPIYAAIYPYGICNSDGYLSLHADDWPSLFPSLRDVWLAHAEDHHGKTIHNMALKIISLTSQYGQCTDAGLRAYFDSPMVERWGKEACVQANIMSSKGPFEITMVRGANAA